MNTGLTSSAVSDIVISGGRVLDPETGFDAIADVALSAGRITAVSRAPIPGSNRIDATGLVVAPGWIDLHSHSHTVVGHRLQACDGVTTVLDLEVGASPLSDAYDTAAREGRPLNFGFSASWMQARMRVVGDVPSGGGFARALEHLGDLQWQEDASPTQLRALVATIEDDIAAGGLGIGLTIGYAPGVDPSEYLLLAGAAAEAGVPTFSHVRELVEYAPAGLIDGADELVRAAATTGAHMHYCHINSTSLRAVDRVLGLVDRVQSEGSRVTTECYPYGAAMTGITAPFLRPDILRSRGLTPRSIVYAPTGETVADERRLQELQVADPGGLALIHYLDENVAADSAILERPLLLPGTVVASDALPLTWPDRQAHEQEWPPSENAVAHPRTAGCFSKLLRVYVRERKTLSLMEAVRRATLLPARVLEESVPSMKLKGRMQVGCDADIVVFNPATVSDQATYAQSTRPSVGYRYVFVNGTAVVREGQLDVDQMPGRPVRR